MSDSTPLLNFPGSFQQVSTEDDEPILYPSGTSSASELLQLESSKRFQCLQVVSQKTKHHVHMISQLEKLVYLLVGYQFIKYCHSACLIPAFLHLVIQDWIGCGSVISSRGSERGLNVIKLIAKLENGSDSRDTMMQTMISYVCLSIYWKAIFTFLYHVIFICFWAVPIVNDDNIRVVENGTWWFISFIGEASPRELTANSSYREKLVGLGLPGLLMTDLLILFIQLILFQCTYKQSTLIQKNKVLNKEEIYIVRAPGDTALRVNSGIETVNDIPIVLKVKLFESFKIDSFVNS